MSAPVSTPVRDDPFELYERLPLLVGKRIVITGVVTRQSIAWSVAKAAQLCGAEVVLTTFGRMRRMTERAARRLPAPVEVLELDVNSSEDLEALAPTLGERWDAVDGVVHAIAYAPPDALGGNFLATPATSAELAFRTSAFSLKAIAAALRPMLREAPSGAAIVGLDFDASKAWPSYDWMGVAKAALEAVSRYLARDLGPDRVRVNLISAGPLATTAARGVPDFDELVRTFTQRAPLGWDTRTPEVVAGPACFLLSDLAAAVSGEIVHVDGGFNAVGTARGIRD